MCIRDSFRTTKDMIYAPTKTFHKDWRAVLPTVELGLRSTVSTATGFSPYQVVFGRTMRLPLTWTDGHERNSDRTGVSDGNRLAYATYITELESHLDKVQSLVRSKAKDRQMAQMSTHEKKAQPYEVGELVMARIFPPIKGVTIPRFKGPYKITGKLGPWTYELRNTATDSVIHRNHHHVKKCSPAALASSSQKKRLQVTEVQCSPAKQCQQHPQRVRFPTQRYGFSLVKEGGSVRGV